MAAGDSGFKAVFFDFGGTLFDGRDIRVVDCGDVPGDANDLTGHYRRAEATLRRDHRRTRTVPTRGLHGQYRIF